MKHGQGAHPDAEGEAERSDPGVQGVRVGLLGHMTPAGS